MANKKATPKKKQSKSFILTLAFILLAGYFVITIIGLRTSIKESREELEQKVAIYEQQIAENERLQATVDADDKSEYIEQVARENLGFVKPNEKVFFDVTPGA